MYHELFVVNSECCILSHLGNYNGWLHAVVHVQNAEYMNSAKEI